MYLASQDATSHRYKRSLSLILCDVDLFKAYNDNYGHQAGDECLRRVATDIKSCCRRTADLAARHGGEEIAATLPETNSAGAIQIAQSIKDAVAHLRIPHGYSPPSDCVSVSGGIASLSETLCSTPLQKAAARQIVRSQKERTQPDGKHAAEVA